MPDAEPWDDVRAEVARLCAGFPGEYWRRLDAERRYPTAFVEALTASGYLAALIPEDDGGAGLPLSTARRSGPAGPNIPTSCCCSPA